MRVGFGAEMLKFLIYKVNPNILNGYIHIETSLYLLDRVHWVLTMPTVEIEMEGCCDGVTRANYLAVPINPMSVPQEGTYSAASRLLFNITAILFIYRITYSRGGHKVSD